MLRQNSSNVISLLIDKLEKKEEEGGDPALVPLPPLCTVLSLIHCGGRRVYDEEQRSIFKYLE